MNNLIKPSLLVASLLLANLANAAGPADQAPPPAPAPGYTQLPSAPPPPPPGRGMSVQDATVEGTVRQLLINPFGEVDGLMLDNRQIIKFPPHMSEVLAAAVKVGTPVKAVGDMENPGTLRAQVIVNQSSGQIVAERPPQPLAERPLPPHLRAAQMENFQVQGKIQVLLTGPAGDTNGAVLDDGSIVRFAPMTLSRDLAVGQFIAVAGVGARNAYGTSVEALRVADSVAALQASSTGNNGLSR